MFARISSMAILGILIIGGVLADDEGLPQSGDYSDALGGSTIIANSCLPMTGEKTGWQVISGGGGSGTSPNFGASCTIAQTAIGSGASTSFTVYHGFWQESEGGAVYLCGDANSDNDVNVGDAVYLIAYVFSGGPPPNPVCVGDANGDGDVNIGDAVYLIAYVFSGGPPPVEGCCP